MLNREHFAITLARTVEAFRTAPDEIPAHKAALRALVALTKLSAARVTLVGDALSVEDTTIPRTLPLIPMLVEQMQRHGVRELALAHRASAADVLGLIRALAAEPDGSAGLGGFADATVTVLTAEPEPEGRPISVTQAFAAAPLLVQTDDLETLIEIGGAPVEAAVSDATRRTLRGAGQSVGALIDAIDAARDGTRRAAIYRTLGRIGTPEAMQALVAAVQPGGRFLGRRPASRRIPAIDGLAVAGGPAALGTIEGLVKDADRHVRRAAKAALQEMRGTHD